LALEEVVDDCAVLVNDCSPLDDEDAIMVEEEAVDDMVEDKADDEDNATHIEAVDDENDDDSVSSSITLQNFNLTLSPVSSKLLPIRSHAITETCLVSRFLSDILSVRGAILQKFCDILSNKTGFASPRDVN
jgi:hypothetical protein